MADFPVPQDEIDAAVAPPPNTAARKRRLSALIKAAADAAVQYTTMVAEEVDNNQHTLETAEDKCMEYAKVVGYTVAGGVAALEYNGPGLGQGPVSGPVASAISRALVGLAAAAPRVVAALATVPGINVLIGVTFFNWLVTKPLVKQLQDAMDAAADKAKYEEELEAAIAAMTVDGGRRKRGKRRGGAIDDATLDKLLEEMSKVDWTKPLQDAGKAAAGNAKSARPRLASEADPSAMNNEGSQGSVASEVTAGRRRTTRHRHRRHRPSAPTRKVRRTSYGGHRRYTRQRRG